MKAFIVLVILAASTHTSFGHLRGGACHPNECHEAQGLRCRIQYSSCHIGECRCDNGYVYSDETRSCVDAKTTGETCKVQAQCPLGTRCSDNFKCECDPDYTTGVFMDDSRACRDTTVKKVLGETCSDDNDCNSYSEGAFTSDAVCTTLTCACPATGYTTEGLACILNDVVGSACAVDAQCPGAFNDPISGSCSSGTCQCDAGYTSVMDGRDCRKPIIEKNKECIQRNSTHGCVDKLVCHQCASGALFLCTVDNGAQRSIFGLTSALIGALLVFIMRNHVLA